MKKIMFTIIIVGVMGFVACGPKRDNHNASLAKKDGKLVKGKPSDKPIDAQNFEQSLKSTANENAVSRDNELYPFYQMLSQMGNIFNESWMIARSIENDRSTSAGKQNPFSKANNLLTSYIEKNKGIDNKVKKTTESSASPDVVRKSTCDVKELNGQIDLIVKTNTAGDKELVIVRCDPDPASKEKDALRILPIIKLTLKSSGDFEYKIYTKDLRNTNSKSIYLDKDFNYGLGTNIEQMCPREGGNEVCDHIFQKMKCTGNFDTTQYTLNKLVCNNLVKEFNNSSSFVFNELSYNSTGNDLWNMNGNQIQPDIKLSGQPQAVNEVKLKEAFHPGDKKIDLVITALVDPEADKAKKDKEKDKEGETKSDDPEDSAKGDKEDTSKNNSRGRNAPANNTGSASDEEAEPAHSSDVVVKEGHPNVGAGDSPPTDGAADSNAEGEGSTEQQPEGENNGAGGEAANNADGVQTDVNQDGSQIDNSGPAQVDGTQNTPEATGDAATTKNGKAKVNNGKMTKNLNGTLMKQ